MSEATKILDMSSLRQQPRRLAGWLVEVGGPNKGRDHRVFFGKALIGSAADCDIVLSDPRVAPHHASLRVDEDTARLVDLDSPEGMRVNRRRRVSVDLVDRDLVELGDTSLRFRTVG